MVQGQSERKVVSYLDRARIGPVTIDNLLVMVRVVAEVTVYVTFLYANVVGSGQ